MTTFHVGGISNGPRPPDVSLSVIAQLDEQLRSRFRGCPNYFKSISVGLKASTLDPDSELDVFVNIETSRTILGMEDSQVRRLVLHALQDSVRLCGYRYKVMFRYQRPYNPTLVDDLDYLAGLTEAGS
jgi:hypothetical protein